jgi:hypothetical protein
MYGDSKLVVSWLEGSFASRDISLRSMIPRAKDLA